MSLAQITVRLFSPNEWPLCKAIRLKALQSDSESYGSSHAREAAWTDQEWQDRLAKKDSAVFGLFDNATVIGIGGIYISDEEPDLACMWGLWMEKNWRGKGLTKEIFVKCLDWARQYPQLKRIYIGHRDGNIASERMILGNGFVYAGAEDYTWPDGKTELLCKYELRI